MRKRWIEQIRVASQPASFLFVAGLLLAPFSLFAQSQAGTALRFNGTNTYVSIPHSAALNAYPLTITAWVKTLRNTSLVDGIVSKYPDASGNGYSINLRNGNLYAWYFRAPGSAISGSPFGLDGGAIADGHWHHIAFVVSTTTGTVYVDGNLRNATSWTGTPGEASNTEPLLIGQYYTIPTRFIRKRFRARLMRSRFGTGPCPRARSII